MHRTRLTGLTARTLIVTGAAAAIGLVALGGGPAASAATHANAPTQAAQLGTAGSATSAAPAAGWWAYPAPASPELGAPAAIGVPVNPSGLSDPSDAQVADPSALTATSASISSPPTATAASSVPAGAYDIVNTFNCQCYNGQKTIAYRRGYYVAPNTGFGRTKVIDKHNLQDNAVAAVVAAPGQKSDGGTSGIATNYANREVDGEIQTVEVQVVYDTRILSDKRSFGIVTGYCVGYNGACPGWINSLP